MKSPSPSKKKSNRNHEEFKSRFDEELALNIKNMGLDRSTMMTFDASRKQHRRITQKSFTTNGGVRGAKGDSSSDEDDLNEGTLRRLTENG